MEDKPILYLAGPSGFTEIGKNGIRQILNMLKPFFKIIDPFNEPRSKPYAEKMIQITAALNNPEKRVSFSEAMKELKEACFKIGEVNEIAIEECDCVLAILDGADVDSGTSAEIGFAYALRKPIWGYRGDFRVSGDSIGTTVNLQVEYFIRASGGVIFRTIKNLQENIPHLLEKLKKS